MASGYLEVTGKVRAPEAGRQCAGPNSHGQPPRQACIRVGGRGVGHREKDGGKRGFNVKSEDRHHA